MGDPIPGQNPEEIIDNSPKTEDISAPEDAESIEENKKIRIENVSTLAAENYRHYIDGLKSMEEPAAKEKLLEHMIDQMQALETVAYDFIWDRLPKDEETLKSNIDIRNLGHVALKSTPGHPHEYLSRLWNTNRETFYQLIEIISRARHEERKKEEK